MHSYVYSNLCAKISEPNRNKILVIENNKNTLKHNCYYYLCNV